MVTWTISIHNYLARLTIWFKPVRHVMPVYRKFISWKFFETFRAASQTVNKFKFSCVVNSMFGYRSQLKIFNPVVCSYPIFMVDYFKRKWLELSTEMFFHDDSMLSNLFSIKVNEPITMSYGTTTVRGFQKFGRVAVFSKPIIVLCTKILSMCDTVTIFISTYAHELYYTRRRKLIKEI